MFSFFSRKSGGSATPWRGQTHGTMANCDEELGLADDGTEAGSTRETKEKDTGDTRSKAPEPTEIHIKVAGEMVSSKRFHPDFIDTGDYIVACKPKDQDGGSSMTTYFSVHYRTMRTALEHRSLPPPTEDYTPSCFPETPANLAVLLRVIHSLHPAFADAPPWTMNKCIDLHRMLKEYGVQKHIVDTFNARLVADAPRMPKALGSSPSYEQVFALMRVVLFLTSLERKSSDSETPAEKLLHKAITQADAASIIFGNKQLAKCRGWNLLHNPYDVPAKRYADPEGAKIWDMCFAIVRFCRENKASLWQIRVTLSRYDMGGGNVWWAMKIRTVFLRRNTSAEFKF